MFQEALRLLFLRDNLAQGTKDVTVLTDALLKLALLALKIIQNVRLVAALAKHSGDVLDGKLHLSQPHDDSRLLRLACVIEAIASRFIHRSRKENPFFMIESKGLHRQTRDLRELTDAV